MGLKEQDPESREQGFYIGWALDRFIQYSCHVVRSRRTLTAMCHGIRSIFSGAMNRIILFIRGMENEVKSAVISMHTQLAGGFEQKVLQKETRPWFERRAC
jgi:hypothetical protein